MYKGMTNMSLSKHVCKPSYRINYEWMGRTDTSSYVPCHKLMTVAGCGWSNHQIHKKRASFACLSSYMLRVDNKPTCKKIQVQLTTTPHRVMMTQKANGNFADKRLIRLALSAEAWVARDQVWLRKGNEKENAPFYGYIFRIMGKKMVPLTCV